MWISGVTAPSFDYSESSGYGHPSFTDGSKVWTLSRKLSSVKKRDDDYPRGLLSGPMTIGLGKNCQLFSLKLPAAMWIWSWSPHQNFAGNDIDSKENITGKISLWYNEHVCWYVWILCSFPCSQNHFMTWDWQTPGVEQTWCSGAGCVGPTTACLMVPTTAESTKHSATEDLSNQLRGKLLALHTEPQWRKVTVEIWQTLVSCSRAVT